MVDSLGFNKIKSITRNEAAVGSGKEKSRPDKKQSSKDDQEKDRDKGRIGGNVDETC